MVTDFVKTLKEGKSKVKQLIMGAGKTAVVTPLLALMMGDGETRRRDGPGATRPEQKAFTRDLLERHDKANIHASLRSLFESREALR